eukprot:scaffold456_cov390-Prasinococcus_capsulatus_cf.AAC.4
MAVRYALLLLRGTGFPALERCRVSHCTTHNEALWAVGLALIVDARTVHKQHQQQLATSSAPIVQTPRVRAMRTGSRSRRRAPRRSPPWQAQHKQKAAATEARTNCGAVVRGRRLTYAVTGAALSGVLQPDAKRIELGAPRRRPATCLIKPTTICRARPRRKAEVQGSATGGKAGSRKPVPVSKSPLTALVAQPLANRSY